MPNNQFEVPASTGIQKGSTSYRVFRVAPAPGDLFEIDVSVKALAVGPESDFSAYEVYYVDPTAQPPYQSSAFAGLFASGPSAKIQKLILSANQPIPLFVDLANNYPNQVPGKIYIRPLEPAIGFPTATSDWSQNPNVDIICYTGEVPGTAPLRAKKTFRASVFELVAKTFTFPVFGRRYYDVKVALLAGANAYAGSLDVTIRAGLLNYIYAPNLLHVPQGSASAHTNQRWTLNAATTLSIAGTAQLSFFYDALLTTGTGRFDYLQIVIDNLTVGGDNAAGPDAQLAVFMEVSD